MAFNQYGFQQVDYEVHFREFAAPFLVDGNTASNLYFVHEAQQNHIYSINNALLELLSDALTLLSAVSFASEAEHFLRYGIMRRLRMLNSSFRSFQRLVPPNRTVPLSQSQSDEACADLNAMYINILGLLDNYAWVLVHQLGSPSTKAAGRMAIGLFKPALSRDPGLSTVTSALASFSAWEEEMKSRRNPAAHRMPLYVPRGSFSPEQLAEFERVDQMISESLHAGELDKIEPLTAKRDRIGNHLPLFMHDPGETPIEIYPTVPHDIGQSISVGRIVQAFLREPGTSEGR